MATSTTSQRGEAKVDTIADGESANAAAVGLCNETPSRSPGHSGPEHRDDDRAIVLPDVVELPWDPYYLEPPD